MDPNYTADVIAHLREHIRKYGYCPNDPSDSVTDWVNDIRQFTFAYILDGSSVEACLYRANESLMVSYYIPSGHIEVEKYDREQKQSGVGTQWRKDLQKEVKRLELQQFTKQKRKQK